MERFPRRLGATPPYVNTTTHRGFTGHYLLKTADSGWAGQSLRPTNLT